MEEKKQAKIKFMIYPPQELIDAYEKIARENNRSVSGEIIYAMKKHLTQHEQQ